MIICLYDFTETEFNGNGLGPLSDAISCTVTRNLENGVYELNMVYPADGVLVDELKVGAIISARPSPNKRGQLFDVVSVIKTMPDQIEVIAHHVSYRLNYIPIGAVTITDPDTAGDDLKAGELLIEPSLFNFEISVQNASWSNTIPRSAMDCLLAEEDSIVSTYGGEIDFDRFDVTLVDQVGSAYDQATIRYGKNLLELSDDVEGGLPNGIFPYWHKDDVGTVFPSYTIPASDRREAPRFEIVDMTSDFESKPTAAQLKTEAEARAAALVLTDRSLTFSFEDLTRRGEYETLEDLERVYIGDTVRVVHPALNIRTTARIIETVFDVLADRYDSVTAGSSQNSLASTIAGGQSGLETALNQKLTGIISTKSITLTTSYSFTAGQAKGGTPDTNVDVYPGYYPLEVVRMRASNNNISFAEARLNRGDTTTVTFGARNNSGSALSNITIRAIILYVKNDFAITL